MFYPLPSKMEQGLFYPLGDGFFLPTKDLKAKTVIEPEIKLAACGMFHTIHTMKDENGDRVGYHFTTRFPFINRGGYLVTYLKQKEQATQCDVLIKNEFLILYDYQNRGTLAVSPTVSPELITIFEEQ